MESLLPWKRSCAQMNFTEDEFALLRQAQNRSDALIESGRAGHERCEGTFPR